MNEKWIERVRGTVVLATAIVCAVLIGCASSSRDSGASADAQAERPSSASSNAIAEQDDTIEAMSLFGEPLRRPVLPPEVRSLHQFNLQAAEQEYARDPRNEEAIIWMGRRLAYLARYREAIDVYTRGLEIHPDSWKLLRHRGHRYITVREFDRAIADLSRAAELAKASGAPDEFEPDGIPNKQNRPRSTNFSNIYYHLGLAHYLKGEFDQARRAYLKCLEYSRVSDDMLVATVYWLYNTYRKMDQDAVASALLDSAIRPDMDIIENDAYERLVRMYKGERTPSGLLDDLESGTVDFATVGYGLGNWYLCNGDELRALELFNRVLAAGQWAAFGSIAAEADAKRLRDAAAAEARE